MIVDLLVRLEVDGETEKAIADNALKAVCIPIEEDLGEPISAYQVLEIRDGDTQKIIWTPKPEEVHTVLMTEILGGEYAKPSILYMKGDSLSWSKK